MHSVYVWTMPDVSAMVGCGIGIRMAGVWLALEYVWKGGGDYTDLLDHTLFGSASTYPPVSPPTSCRMSLFIGVNAETRFSVLPLLLAIFLMLCKAISLLQRQNHSLSSLSKLQPL